MQQMRHLCDESLIEQVALQACGLLVTVPRVLQELMENGYIVRGMQPDWHCNQLAFCRSCKTDTTHRQSETHDRIP